jgi:putative FmdB family regulatory protein
VPITRGRFCPTVIFPERPSRDMLTRTMPIYEYSCRKCGHAFEQLVRKGDIPACPKCSGEDLERLLSLCSVSSEHTREINMRGARAQAKAAHRDREHEYHKQLHSHDD